ncbi:MAG: type II methionyl aminopeptidase [Candidatus Nanoarchaeia archaeon]|nr:type II methionyl aminopeptidase [Candidatus Nanoarchaeia archaeon]MDD5357940.1 type II methionyl aminopeptidase [Candidatus Nanoarchaeia archaeon]MDD5588859.1 type II methionyl aminopeptidase [Candidatus Nanoarchaeia archaeon]
MTSRSKQKEKILQAGKIASEVKEWIKPQIKKGMPLLELAEKIENKIKELKGKPAFPTNLSINEIAAHYTPSYNDETKASGLLKVDFGVHVDGWIADTAFSVDLENNSENKKLIEASEKALKNAIREAEKKSSLGEIGKVIQETMESYKFSPIVNLTGHEMEEYELHAGLTIMNIKTTNKEKLSEGLYAIEPFATNGSGKIYEGKPSGIYILIDSKNVRNPTAREILDFIADEYQTLPFCSRWLVKKFGIKSLFALKQLEENGNLHQYPQLIEVSHAKVSQAENTILVDDKIIVTSE